MRFYRTHAGIALLAVLSLLIAQIAILYAMGRVPICTCGYVKLFEPGVNTEGNSQHLMDWYTPSHIIHGFIFYLVFYFLLRGKSFGTRLTFALVVEVFWELLENSPLIIDRYRSETAAVGYAGDSILNSVSDSLFMILGFWFAARAPVWLTITIAIAFELLTGWIIRDNLTLNVIMLIWPIEAVRTWQGGLG